MYWGAGPALGLLTVLGYVAFTIGAALVWRNRDDFSIWVHDEFGAFRRSLSRYIVIGPFIAFGKSLGSRPCLPSLSVRLAAFLVGTSTLHLSCFFWERFSSFSISSSRA